MKWLVKWILLALPFGLAAVVVFEIWLRFNLQVLSGNFPCLRGSSVEASVLLPGCSAKVSTPRGKLDYSTNEDGWRDRPRSLFSKGAYYVAGDSQVEGPWLRDDEVISRKLEKRITPKLGYPFLNLGMRGAGPTQEAVRIILAMEKYRPKGVVWFLNPTDPLDEIYFHARNPGYELRPEKLMPVRKRFEGKYSIWKTLFSISELMGDQVLSLLFILDHLELQRLFQKAVTEISFDEKLHCASLKKAAAVLRRKNVPLVFIAMPHGPPARNFSYFGIPLRDSDFQSLLACARDTGSVVIPTAEDFSFTQDLFWPNDWHLNPEGIDRFTEYLAKIISPALLAPH